MKTIFTLIWFLTSLVSYSQRSTYKMDMVLERVPTSHPGVKLTETRNILMVFEGDYFGIYTGHDTLILKLVKPLGDVDVYKDVMHNNQEYYVRKLQANSGFSVFIVPIKPYKRKLWSINISNI